MYRERRKQRSDLYQCVYHEKLFPSEILESFSNDSSISHRLNPFESNEDLMDLEDQLKVEFWRIVNSCLTERQRQVIRLYSDGYTQMEIAKILKVNQSSITKSIHGNVDYKKNNNSRKKKGVSYGGSSRKIRKIIESDDKIKSILAKIAELRELKW